MMFTGLVEETGIIVDLKKINDGLECIIEANLVLEDLKTNDSISCSGICLTATKVNENSFKVQLVNETLERTTAKHWKESSVLNLERALLPSTRLGGHLVQGHVDTVTTIKNIQRLDESAIFTFEIDAVNRKYIVEKGSVCLDGISLTVASISETQFTIALIPHTLGVTSWENSRVGDQVNLEVDIMAKYIENMMSKK
ncbi:MAG: riboflavin synthase [Candidatus Marinimicrobia bacterium]|nr:riboflavin synthase [Candidatus Neomarinimicrobiota bacterium]|tara:strand:+ start:2028 stop:2621 length:594 start_codon:yes stop_codon:yes gene_type:complete